MTLDTINEQELNGWLSQSEQTRLGLQAEKRAALETIIQTEHRIKILNNAISITEQFAQVIRETLGIADDEVMG
jgi:hypothetical protein